MVRRQPSGLPLAEAIALGPGSFGVRPPILAEWADPAVPVHSQTAYLRRDVDDRLEQVIAAVTSDGSRIAVLVGALGVGKTRACWEAVHRLPPDWRVWCPGTAEGLLGGVQRQGRRRPAASLRPRTVLWLDRLERYLDPQDTEVAAHVVRFLAALLDNAAVTPVLVLGTLPSSVDRWLLTSSRGRDPGPVALCRKISDLLRGSEYPVLATLSPEETDAAQHAALSDPRWRTALDLAPQRPIPYLAGVTSILDRYERATLAVKAVLTAAGDARRAGAPRGLPSGFLEEAAVGYLPPQTPADDGDSTPQQRPSAKAREAVRAALVLAMVERAGIPGPLRAIPTRTGAGEGPEPVIVLAGCLEQHLRASRPTEQPKDSLWAAALTGFAQPTVLATLARAAEDRGRYGPAARLYERAWALGDLDAGVRVAALRDRAGDIAGAEQAAGQVADVEGPQAWMALAHRRAAVGDRSGADRALERAAAAGHGQALVLLARRRELSGDAEGAERAAAEAARVGHADAWMALGELRARAGHQAAAWHAFTQAGRSGNPNGWAVVARWEEQSGHTAGAEHACRMAAMAGLPSAWTGLATLREDAGDTAGADRAARAAAAWGDPRAWTALARSRERAGDLPAAADAFEQAARAGDVDGWTELARLHEQAGDHAAAEHAARRCAAAGSAHAWMQLAVMCEHADDPLAAARALAHGVRSRDGRHARRRTGP
ncbi:MAG TPA: hypothetical protein VHN80_01820 [Kineosporiaceae bacterium]|nr:hypothetical protein [Kineosporiaceae bacterium]